MNTDRNEPYIHPSILTVSGEYFDFLNPEKSIFGIEDIAHGLSNVCRFAGHTNSFYSVAQHSYLVSKIVPPEHALAGLLHDAHEFAIGDMTTPLKRLLPEFRALELRVKAAVLARFGLTLPLHPSIKEGDLKMLVTEQRDLLPPHDNTWELTKNLEPCPERIDPWPPASAKMLFLQRFHELTS